VNSPVVRVETAELDGRGQRQISDRRRTTELLADRRADIESAIQQAADIVAAAARDRREPDGWRTKTIEATFGITVAAEAGVVLTKASAGASFEVTITVERC
jgi:hypothetical protein